MVDFLFTRGQVLTAVLLLLLGEDARETLAAALWMRRGGANAWAAAVERDGAAGSRRRRDTDFFSSDLCVRASSWGRSLFRRVYSRESFCVSTWQYVSMSVGSV